MVSGISSYTVDDWECILENPYLYRWYSTNPPVNPRSHDKMYTLPIGFEEKEREGGDQEFLKSLYKKRFTDKKKRILLPYHDFKTNSKRKQYYDKIKKYDLVDHISEKMSFKDYMNLLSQYEYCICLAGAGNDVHRHYECAIVDTVIISIDDNRSSASNHWVLLDYNIPHVIWLDGYDGLDTAYEVMKIAPPSPFCGKPRDKDVPKVSLTIDSVVKRITDHDC